MTDDEGAMSDDPYEMPIAELRDAPKQNYDLPGDTWGSLAIC